MRKYIALLLMIAICLSFPACGVTENNWNESTESELFERTRIVLDLINHFYVSDFNSEKFLADYEMFKNNVQYMKKMHNAFMKSSYSENLNYHSNLSAMPDELTVFDLFIESADDLLLPACRKELNGQKSLYDYFLIDDKTYEYYQLLDNLESAHSNYCNLITVYNMVTDDEYVKYCKGVRLFLENFFGSSNFTYIFEFTVGDGDTFDIHKDILVSIHNQNNIENWIYKEVLTCNEIKASDKNINEIFYVPIFARYEKGCDYVYKKNDKHEIVLVGRIPKDVEIIGGDKEFAEITLAVPRSYKNEEGEYETDFVDVILYGQLAVHTAEYCKKGDLVGVKGRIQTTMVEDHKVTQVICEKVTFLSSKAPSEEGE